ncbi:hypothetical protein HY501_03135, partial [Candidatus Woesearchaeota archaeon]|nr:hypothetical protein [Candidatus Woesearchaeota archaeon]
MKINPSGMVSIDDLRDDDRFLIAVGSEQRRHAYLDRIRKEFHWVFYGNWQRIRNVDYTISQGRLLFLCNLNFGLGGGSFMGYDGRLVGVRERSEQLAPRAQG